MGCHSTEQQVPSFPQLLPAQAATLHGKALSRLRRRMVLHRAFVINADFVGDPPGGHQGTLLQGTPGTWPTEPSPHDLASLELGRSRALGPDLMERGPGTSQGPCHLCPAPPVRTTPSFLVTSSRTWNPTAPVPGLAQPPRPGLSEHSPPPGPGGLANQSISLLPAQEGWPIRALPSSGCSEGP